MTFKKKSSGAWTDIATTRKRMSGGAWVNIDKIMKRAAGVWSIVFRSINIADWIITHDDPTTAIAGYRLNSSGVVEQRMGGSYSTLETWLGAYTNSGYEVRATLLSGTIGIGTFGSWLNLGTSREWATTSTSGFLAGEMLIEIRNATTLVVVDSANIQLEAQEV